MIPTYNPRPDYLEQVLRSVLAQDSGRKELQIEVVDDCSPNVDVAAMVKRIAGARIAFARTPEHLGLAGGWNECIARAAGQWVHILHQDDIVLSNFYSHVEQVAKAHPEAGAIFTRYAYADEDGHWTHLAGLERRTAGLLANPLLRLCTAQRIQCPAIAVKREVYNDLGGFRNDLKFILDWEMWVRIASKYDIGYCPELLSVYRMHSLSATEGLRKTGGTVADLIAGTEVILNYLPPASREFARGSYLDIIYREAVKVATKAFASGDARGALRHLKHVRGFSLRTPMRRECERLRIRAFFQLLKGAAIWDGLSGT